MIFSHFTVCKNIKILLKSPLSLIVKIMLPERIWAFLKKCTYKEKCGTVTKRGMSSVKNVIINQISLEHLADL